MRILYAIARAVPGGAQTHVLDLITHARKIGEPGLVAFESGHLTDQACELGVPVWVVPAPVDALSIYRDAAALRGIARVIREFRPHLVHAHSSKTGVIARAAARLTGVPAVFTAHGWAFTEGVSERRRRLAIAIERVAARAAKRIICVSEYDRNLALSCKVGSPEKVTVIPNAIAPSDVVTRHSQRDVVRCAMVARFSPPKDQASLIRAMRDVKGIELVLLGDGELIEDSRALASVLGVEDRVRFLGSRSDVPDVLADCDIFALVSRWEGLPYTILEAMRAGLPVIASDVGGVGEAVIEGETGYLLRSTDVAELSAKLQRLVDHPEERRRMGQAGRQRCLTAFTLSRMLESTFAVYGEVLGRKKGHE